ncbi:hypothetical protein PoB_007149200 [Plakobranchus ocellatus]|uniref:Uncharacterized protein n=1 Tax=Plakobranchus ocellatus TaxID=259542 RepID=A0AAV4DL37_9GAST|nr:hypothetical protein PoB_007149200 [Plakobranchus ocellatus]
MDAVFVYYQRRRLRRLRGPRIMWDRSNPLDFMDDVDVHSKFRFVRADILYIIALIHDVINYESQRELGLSSSLQVLGCILRASDVQALTQKQLRMRGFPA